MGVSVNEVKRYLMVVTMSNWFEINRMAKFIILLIRILSHYVNKSSSNLL